MDDPNKGHELQTRTAGVPDANPPTQTAEAIPASQENAATGGNNDNGAKNNQGDGGNQTGINWRRFFAFVALAFMWTDAQAPLFFWAAVPGYVYNDIGGLDYWAWLASANLLTTAAISPFVAGLSDIWGRRKIAIAGTVFLVVGQIICGLAKNMTTFIIGMAISGVGTGIHEIIAIAGTAELVPVNRRGYSLTWIVLAIIPFIPCVLIAQMIASSPATWRAISAVTGGWAALGLVPTLLAYHPVPQGNEVVQDHEHNETGLIQRLLRSLKRMDVLGGLLSFGGLAMFEAGILGGGYNNPWGSKEIVIPLVFGSVLIVGFFVWEFFFASNPIIPRSLGSKPRTMILTLLVTFVSGGNFFSVLMLWPSEAVNVYGNDPVGVGLRGLPFACGVLCGCVISLVLLSRFPRRVKWILVGSSFIMTLGCGFVTVAEPDNFPAVAVVLVLAGLGVGGIVVPAATVTTIISPRELIAKFTALTITIRIVGGAIGYAIYFAWFQNNLTTELETTLVDACVQVGITDRMVIIDVVTLTATSMVDRIRDLPGIDETKWEALVAAGQLAYSNSYRVVYYISIAFGNFAIICSLFMEDISNEMTGDIAATLEGGDGNRN